MSEIWQLCASELAQRIARRQLSSVEVVDARLARINAVNPAAAADADLDTVAVRAWLRFGDAGRNGGDQGADAPGGPGQFARAALRLRAG